MNPIKTIIIDDEYESRKTLYNFLSKYCPDVQVAAEAASVQEAVPIIKEAAPHLVFLDINMPGENGFQLFARLPEVRFHTIFVTAYDEYALQAIKHNALDYILKPIDITELIIAVNKVKDKAEKEQVQQLHKFMDTLERMPDLSKMAFPTMEGFVYVYTSDIMCCKAENNYTYIYLKDGRKIVASRNLGFYEEQLSPKGFIRVHHAYLVNLNFIKCYHKGRGGYIELENGMTVEVSARKKDAFLARFK
jgi:Response regulator of the LytR/AlgR family